MEISDPGAATFSCSFSPKETKQRCLCYHRITFTRKRNAVKAPRVSFRLLALPNPVPKGFWKLGDWGTVPENENAFLQHRLSNQCTQARV